MALDLFCGEAALDAGSAKCFVLGKILPRCCGSSSAVFAATAALGAVLEAISSPKNGKMKEDDVDSLYHLALELLQKEIGAKKRDPVALFLASIVLAWVETLGRHLTHALIHVRGALKIFTEYLTKDDEAGKSNAGQLYDGPELQVLSIFALTLDLQNTTYKFSLPLQLPNTEFEWLGRVSLDDEHHLVLLLHACYSFAAEAAQYKYLSEQRTPSSLLERQSMLLSLLRQRSDQQRPSNTPLTISGDNGELCTSTNFTSSHTQVVDQLRCLVALIYLSTILSPYEESFDDLLELFNTIVQGAEVTLRDERQIAHNDGSRIRTISHLSQPLFLTAMKCRHSHLRRKAIQLLSCTGKEGPWDAEILVPVATRAMEIEENFHLRASCSSVRHRSEAVAIDNTALRCQLSGYSIAERARLHGCGMGYVTEDSGSPGGHILRVFSHGSERRKLKFHFRRCVNMEKLMSCEPDDLNKASSADLWEEWDESIVL